MREVSGTAGAGGGVVASMSGLNLEDFSLATILVAVLFSIVGFAAFRYGKKNGEPIWRFGRKGRSHVTQKFVVFSRLVMLIS